MEREYKQRESVLMTLLLGVSFTSALLIAAPIPILPQKLREYGYGPIWNGVVFSAFALSVARLGRSCPPHYLRVYYTTVPYVEPHGAATASIQPTASTSFMFHSLACCDESTFGAALGSAPRCAPR
jgi:hypothetical protein